jgi:hypothetical protein
MQRNLAPPGSPTIESRAYNHVDAGFLRRLFKTRSVSTTARELGWPEHKALRAAMVAYGLGRLDFRLKDF